MPRYLIVFLILAGCSSVKFNEPLPKPQGVDIHVDNFRTLVIVKNGDRYDVHLKCYPGYSLSKRKILGVEFDCDAETIAGRPTVNLDIGTIQDLAAQLLEARCVKP